MLSSNLSKRVIIDTDCGVDDAVAILWALTAHVTSQKASEQSEFGSCQLLAITCCSGNTHCRNVCNNVSHVLDVADVKDIPIYAGAHKPIIGEWKPPVWQGHGVDGLGNTHLGPGKTQPQNKHAALALIELTNQYPNDVYILTLGPLTNLAIAVLLDPTLPSRVKGLTMMGGAYKGHGNASLTAEFNILSDPEAARIVFDSFPMIQMVSWELTLDSSVSWSWYDQYIKAGTSRYATFVRQITGNYEKVSRGPHRKRDFFNLCDVLAVAVLLRPNLIKERVHCFGTVELNGSLTRGMTCFDWMSLVEKTDKQPNVEIVTAVHVPQYHELFARLLAWK